MAEREFDVVVLGAGPAGEVAAGRCGEGGLSVALVEPHLVGGECSYYACMPSKALLRPGELLTEVRRIPGVSEAVTGELDVQAILDRRDEVIHDLDDSSQIPWLEDRGVTVVRGEGRLDGERRVVAGDEVLVARKAVVVATGSSATMPDIPGLRDARPWDNREATTTKEPPRRLVIMGGGVVGVEMAQAWSSLGVEVVVIEGLHRLISREEPFACQLVAAALEERGVELHRGTKATAVRREGDEVAVDLEDGATVTGDELLVAVGRRPRTDGIGLESVGIATDRPLEVDDGMRVPGHDWLYAVGDVNGRVLLTHMGKYQARVAADRILGKQASVRSDGALSPRVIFTDPEVAAVGHTLESAQKAGLNVRAVDYEIGHVAGASFRGREAPGTCRIVVDEDRRVLAGATFTGPEVAESLHAATIAVVAKVGLDDLWHAVPSFPTRSEAWLRLLEEYGL
jgi:pyruvate/2-oxoglutarate dehydrogenase complex dihydrolipoamide dehydrogenase (E3) component